MRKHLIDFSTVGIAVLLGFFAIQCSAKEELPFYIKNGLYYNGSTNQLFTGYITEKAVNKVVQSEVIDGIKEGWFKVYNQNNIVEMKGRLIKNLNQGKWTYYYPNGNVQSEGYFINDVPEGQWNWYYENEVLSETCRFRNGIREGEYLKFNNSGKLIDRKLYINGKEKLILSI